MAKSIKVRNAIVCDYAGNGENNKHILINVYSGDILFTAMPPLIPLGLYIECYLDNEEPIIVTLTMYSNDNVIFQINSEFSPPIDGQYGLFVLQQFPLTLSGETTLKAIISAPGYKSTIAFEKQIKKVAANAFSSVPQQHSVQSRSARKKKAPSL